MLELAMDFNIVRFHDAYRVDYAELPRVAIEKETAAMVHDLFVTIGVARQEV